MADFPKRTAFKDEIIRRAFEAVDQASWSEAELNTYEQMTAAYDVFQLTPL